MTPYDLLESMKAFIERETQNMLLPVRVDKESGENKERKPEVYLMRLPDKDAETQRIPYVLLQFIKLVDSQEEGKPPESFCMVRIVGATYSEDGTEGALCILNLLTRIRLAFMREGMLANRYVLDSPLEMVVYPDSKPPYYLGEMMSLWKMPPLNMEVLLSGTGIGGTRPIIESEVMKNGRVQA